MKLFKNSHPFNQKYIKEKLLEKLKQKKKMFTLLEEVGHDDWI